MKHILLPADNKCGAGHSLGTGGTHTSIARRTMAIRGESTTVTTTSSNTTSATTHVIAYNTTDLDIDDKGLRESRQWRYIADGHAHAIAQCLETPPGLPPTPLSLSCNCTLFTEGFNRCLQLFSDSFAMSLLKTV